MDRLRARIKDKRVCSLVKAFLKSGILTEPGGREETWTGTPQGGILSPRHANIAWSALDDHFDPLSCCTQGSLASPKIIPRTLRIKLVTGR